jgi:hypothetical protein
MELGREARQWRHVQGVQGLKGFRLNRSTLRELKETKSEWTVKRLVELAGPRTEEVLWIYERV